MNTYATLIAIVTVAATTANAQLLLASLINNRLALSRSILDSTERENRENKCLGHPTHHLAKTLEIELDEADIYTGTALQILSRAPYDGCAFPLVRRITFTIFLGDSAQAKQSLVATNISALVQRIKQMAPMAKDFQMRPNAYGVKYHSAGHHFDDLLNGVRNLVCLAYDTRLSSRTLIRLIRRSAPTLESLDIELPKTSVVPSIIQDADGTYISYPRLVSLNLRRWLVDTKVPTSVFKDAVPFPSLRRLAFLLQYPFGDDILFRGNAVTLEYLRMPLGVSTALMLPRHGVFTPQNHPSLRHVSIWNDGLVPGAFATNAEALRFVLSIGTRVSVRVANIPVTGAELIKVIKSLSDLASIQVLSLDRTTLDLWQAITLIMLLPSLADLRTLHPVIGTLSDGIALDNLSAYVVSTFAPMGTEFRHWRLKYDEDGKDIVEDSFKCVLLLALVCPNFKKATSYCARYEEPLKMMERALTSHMFKHYASHLQCFQFLEGDE
ncbi:hypothetical protein GGI17_006282 [Coemansia sp. S146]|nr:hypothetical protein GGI17_006282 [Coemansia sp. S146]